MAVVLACGEPSDLASDVAPAPEAATPSEAAVRQVYFGDLHVHSSWSVDAWASDVRANPQDAYRYARGRAIDHLSGEPIALDGPPLDFLALTEHAEYLGLTNAVRAKDEAVWRQPIIRLWRGDDPALRQIASAKLHDSFARSEGLSALTTDEIVEPAWRSLVALANRENVPDEFTAFVAYEYSPAPDGQNLHRNVLFRGGDAPKRPFSAFDDPDPEALWRWMDGHRANGIDSLAIPHNANGSNGLMFARARRDGSPLDRDSIRLRARNEPAAEVFQIKGQSETHPALSPDDEWADFEIVDWRTLNVNAASAPPGSYLRDALGRGLVLAERFGLNPFALGVVAGTDGHMASSPFEERNFTGKIGRGEATPAGRLDWFEAPTANEPGVPLVTMRWGAAGLAGIWAERNTRAALFDAIRRRETFATSGPRIRLRFFAGWELTARDLTAGLADAGYARGVPMGRVLDPHDAASTASDSLQPGAEPSASSPTFLIAAQQDPLDGRLERIQIVKGWVDGRGFRERIYDVACPNGTAPDARRSRCPVRAPEPDLARCVNDPRQGASELRGAWRDPDFDPDTSAFYYVRALQVPTCRWSTYDANRLGRPPHPAVPTTIRERAVSSPIWVAANPKAHTSWAMGRSDVAHRRTSRSDAKSPQSSD